MKVRGGNKMFEQLKSMIISHIEEWTDPDIYAISLFVCDDSDNPCKPTVTLGYNTERKVRAERRHAFNEKEARWNYAFWLQNDFMCFGVDETAGVVRDWIIANNMPIYEDDAAWEIYELSEETPEITKAFVDLLVRIVNDIHNQKILTKKFGKEIPILIHELEYYDEIAEQNIRANGADLVKDFVDFCING
jgi:hypothetical protein